MSALTGFCQVSPSVDRLTTTAGVWEVFESGSEAIIQTPCFASYATAGSLAASYGPEPSPVVRPGRNPWLQVVPPSVEVAHPMAVAPPWEMRPV